MTNEELKALALAAISANTEYLADECSSEKHHAFIASDDAFQDAANPAVVLGLLAELEGYQQGAKAEADAADEARAEVRRLKAELADLQHLKEYVTRPMRERCAERDALKTECEGLRNALTDCSDSLHSEMLTKFGGQMPDDMHPVTRREYDRDMAEVAEYRAALEQGGQSNDD